MNIITSDERLLFNNEKLNNIIKFIFLSSLILIPFDDLPYFESLGGLGKRAALYPFMLISIIIFIFFIHRRKIYYKNSLEKTLLISYFCWVVFSSLLNISIIASNSFKNQNGIKRLIIQLVSLGFLMFVFYLTELIISTQKIKFETLRLFICLSFVPVAIVGMMEILNIFKIVDFSYALESISNVINSVSRKIFDTSRSRGVNAEPSYLGMYCAFILPWFISYLYTTKEKFKKVLFLIPIMLIVTLVISTKSRTATILLLFELILLLFLVVLFYKNVKTKLWTIVLAGFLILNVNVLPHILSGVSNRINSNINTTNPSTSQKPTTSVENYQVNQVVSSIGDANNMSNIARSGMQKAALKIGYDNLFTGVGIGQFGFHFTDYIDESAYRSPEVQFWSDPNKNDWPSVHSLYHRIFAEEGIIGLLIYVAFIFIVCLKLFIKIIYDKFDLIGICLLVSYCSILIGSLTLDQYVLPHFWIMSAIVVLYTNKSLTTLNKY